MFYLAFRLNAEKASSRLTQPIATNIYNVYGESLLLTRALLVSIGTMYVLMN